ncbi:EmrB/QacA subfamily drug resistance transporter [Kribbella antiqua]|uniref:EmrB/QacA subfamily drug resistance transporter n=1 Tax=Kribbella antiqua TaxID=2512217 RepID=A0A4V2S518_9ACTN|nr:MFS transporter [Kribbella antiqua]TCO50460.1 EmrB/QacA subfamily drug resistance transporter [Kribbella antiqua]
MTTPTRSGPILAIILTSYFMILLDNSVIFTGLPSIRSELGLSATELSWVQDAYTLVFGGLLLLGARAGDLIGRRRLFVIGLAIFTTASFLVGAAPTGWWLIAARALQGIGAAVVAPTSLSLLTANFPEGRERTRAVSWYGATAGIGASLGLVVGGACAHWISWRAGFFINLPVGLALVLAARRYLGETERRTGRFDTVGALTATLGVGAIVFGIVNSADAGWGSLTTVAALAGGVVLLVVLVANEWRAEQPIMPLRLFRSRERSGAYAARLLFLGAMIGFFYFTTQYLQGVLGFSPLQAGLGFFPMTVVNFAVAIAVPRLTRRFGNAMLLAAGLAVTLAGMAWLSRLHAGDVYLSSVALPMVLIGAGQGLAFAPLTAAGISGVTAADAGVASGLVNTFHQLGSALGLALLVAISANATTLTTHVTTALTGSAALLAAALLITLTTRPTRTDHANPRTTAHRRLRPEARLAHGRRPVR